MEETGPTTGRGRRTFVESRHGRMSMPAWNEPTRGRRRLQKAGSRRTPRRRLIRSPVPNPLADGRSRAPGSCGRAPAHEVRLGRRALNRRPMRPGPGVGTPRSSHETRPWWRPSGAHPTNRDAPVMTDRHLGTGRAATCCGLVARVRAQVTGCPAHQEPARHSTRATGPPTGPSEGKASGTPRWLGGAALAGKCQHARSFRHVGSS